jgi:hypothetical protein
MKAPRTFTKFLQKPQHRVITSEIPSSLATEILEKELDFDKTVTLPLINELVSLYTKAIEHYETQENPKYLDFQDRLHRMLLTPAALAVLQQQSLPHQHSRTPRSTSDALDSPTEKAAQFRQSQADRRRKIMSDQLSFVLSDAKSTNSSTGILDAHQSFSEVASSTVKSEIKTQEQGLEQKIVARKNRKLGVSGISHSRQNSSVCLDSICMEDELSSSTKSSIVMVEENTKENLERYEKKLEELMEKSLEAQSGKVLEIRLKYEPQINELSGGGEIVQMVVDEMRKKMQDEIEEVVEGFEKQRKADIKRLKDEV